MLSAEELYALLGKKVYGNKNVGEVTETNVLDVEVNQTSSDIVSIYTFDEIMSSYSAGKDIRVRFSSVNYENKEIIMHNVGMSEQKIEFHSVMELSGKLIFLELECDNQNEWNFYSRQYVPTDNFYNVIVDGAGAHNSIYRGKSLGSSVTEEQLNRIKDGTFTNLFVGDYWEISGVKYIIADFDYMYNVGDTALTKHHVAIISEKSLYSYAMNTADITTGGYTGSKMYSEGLKTALTSLKNAFGEGNIVTYRNYLVNAVASGNPTGCVWANRQIDLLSETMVLGNRVFGSSGFETGCQKTQLSIFKHRHDLICIGSSWWLRNVNSATGFAYIDGNGMSYAANASKEYGVRLFALIG